MKLRLACLLLIGGVGCGTTAAPPSAGRAPSTSQGSQPAVTKDLPAVSQDTSKTSAAPVGNSEAAIAALEQLDARIDLTPI